MSSNWFSETLSQSIRGTRFRLAPDRPAVTAYEPSASRLATGLFRKGSLAAVSDPCGGRPAPRGASEGGPSGEAGFVAAISANWTALGTSDFRPPRPVALTGRSSGRARHDSSSESAQLIVKRTPTKVLAREDSTPSEHA